MSSAARWSERFPVARLPLAGDVAVAVAASGLAYVARLLADPVLPPGFPFLTFFPAVILTAFLLGSRAGALTAVISGLLAWYRFIPPIGLELDRGSAVAMALYLFVTITEVALVHWMQRGNRLLVAQRSEIARLAETRALLFEELQHRVSNNLQVAAALLTIKRKQVADPDARAALDEACQRLGLMGRISRQLYSARDAGQAIGALLHQVGRDVIDASGRADVQLVIEDPGAVSLRPVAAIPVALIAAEAIANAIEHGFADPQEQCAIVILAEQGSGFLLEVRDNGRGLPAGFDLGGSDSLGLRIAAMLAQQLEGRFSLVQGPQGGAVARLELPAACLERSLHLRSLRVTGAR